MSISINLVGVIMIAFSLCLGWCVAQEQGDSSHHKDKAAEISLLSQLFSASADAQWSLRTDGRLDSIRLYNDYANDNSIRLLSNFPSIRELHIQNNGWNKLTSVGMSRLAGLTNLSILTLNCGGMLAEGTFQEICKLRNLRDLGITASCPQQKEYSFLTNLQNLVCLRINFCTNFGDGELSQLTNMANLKHLTLKWNGNSAQGTNILSSMRGLTNVTFRNDLTP